MICLFTWAFEILLLWIGRNGAFALVQKRGLPLRFLTILPMDELVNFKQQKQSVHIIPLDSSVYVHQNTPIVHSDTDGLVFKVERSNSGPENVYDLESGIQVTEPEVTFDRNLFGRVGYNRSSLIRSVNGSVGAPVGKNAIQCGAFQGKESEMGFSFHHNTLKNSSVPLVARQSQDMGLAKAVNADTVSVSCEKIRHENGNPTLKPSWKKPPRPPSRTGTDASRERNMKGISDTALLRRAKLQRMRSMRKHKSVEPSSAKTSFWALLVTISFCVIMIMQGIFSQGTDSPQNSSPRSRQTNAGSLHNFASHASSNGSGQVV